MASWTVNRYRRLKMIKEIKGEIKAEEKKAAADKAGKSA